MKFVSIKRNELVFKGLKNLNDRTKQDIRKSLYKSGLDIAGTANNVNSGLIKQDMNKQKSGRSYKVYVGIGGRRLSKPRFHVASKVGQSPGVITGNLRKSVYFKVEGWDRLEIGATAKYAIYLEEGTKRIGRRNFVFKHILNSKRNITRNINGIIKRHR